MKNWKILNKTDVSPSHWFPVVKHTVELPNGKIIDDYYVSPMGNVAIVVPITSNNEFVLVKQYKHALGETLIELPAGWQKNGATLPETALAELQEETGIVTTADNLFFLGKTANNPTKTNHVTYGYLARNLEFNNARQNCDITEDIEIIKALPSEVLEMVKNGEIWVADSVVNIIRTLFQFPDIFNRP